MKNQSLINLLISALLWIVFITLVSNFEKILLFYIFILLPIALLLVPTIKRNENSSRYHALLLKSHPYFALTIGIALLFPTGSVYAMLLSLPWLIYTLALFGYGFRRMMERGYYIIEENAVDISFLYAFLGGITLSLYCFSKDPTLANHYLITAIHINSTAILSTLFVGFIGRILSTGHKLNIFYRWAVIGTIISPIIIGIGMFRYPWLDNIGLWIYTLSMIIHCLFVFFRMEKNNFITSLFIQLAIIILILTSIFPAINGIYELQGQSSFQIHQWLWFHEIPVAFGFALGLFGWYYRRPLEKNSLYQLPQTNINGGSFIGTDFLERNGFQDQVISHSGIITKMEKFRRTDLMIEQLHPKVVSYLENTSAYDLALHAHWTKGSWLFEKFHKAISNKIQQANIPSPNEGTRHLESKIISIINPNQYWNKKLNAWICNYKNSDETYIVGIWSDHKHNGERYLHFTLPIPKYNRATIYRLEHGINGAVQVISVPRRGGIGDEGHYIMTKNFSIRIPFNESLTIWVDEYGRLQMTHRFYFLGVKVLDLEYEMIAK